MCPYLSGLLGGVICSNRLLSSTWENNTCNTVAHNRLALVTLSVLFAGALSAGQLQLGSGAVASSRSQVAGRLNLASLPGGWDPRGRVRLGQEQLGKATGGTLSQ